MYKNANLKLNQNYNPMTSLNVNTLDLKLLIISCNFDHNIYKIYAHFTSLKIIEIFHENNLKILIHLSSSNI